MENLPPKLERSPFTILAMIGIAGLLSAVVAACSPTSPHTSGDDSATGVFQKHVISNFDLTQSKKIAITIDDGPTRVYSDRILDVLKKENVHATFFLIGANIRGNEATLKRMHDEGHIIGNHSMTHPNLSEGIYVQNPDLVAKQIMDTHNLIAPYLDNQKRPYFRPPGGDWLPSFAQSLNQDPILKSYIGPIYWNIGGEMTFDKEGNVAHSADWACWSPKYAVPVDNCLQGYVNEIAFRQGGVMLMHDKSQKSVELLAKLIPQLKAMGYEFVTLDDVTALDPLQ